MSQHVAIYLFCLTLFRIAHCGPIGCATTDVNIRSGPSPKDSKHGVLRKGECLAYEGLSTSQTWAKVLYNGKDSWIHKTYLSVKKRAKGSYNVCVTTNVNIRRGPGTSHDVLGLLKKGDCLTFRELEQKTCCLRWAAVYYKGERAFVATKYALFKPVKRKKAISQSYCKSNWKQEPDCNGGTIPENTKCQPSDDNEGCPRIISRREWGAEKPKEPETKLRTVPKYVIIHHGYSAPCFDKKTCIARVQAYQRYHKYDKETNWNDIGYSFIIGEDGNVYEGRGWMTEGSHTKKYNRNGYGFCVIGNFTKKIPNKAALNALWKLIKCGVDKGYLKSDYIMKGHRDVANKPCPGQSFYDLIKTCPNFNPKG